MSEEKRRSFNAWMYVIVYAIVGLLGGVALDTLATFLSASESTAVLAASMSIFLGIGFAGGAGLILFIPKVGYKVIISAACLICMAGLFLVTTVNSLAVVAICSALIFVGVCLFDAVLPPVLSCYSNEKNKDIVFSTALWTNTAGMALATFFGGSLISTRFANRLGLTFAEAKALTADLSALTELQHTAYVAAHKDVLLAFIAVAVLALIPTLLMKTKPEDYRASEKKEKTGFRDIVKLFSSKFILLWVLYNFLIRFGASLITPYFSIFLTNLGIDRATVSGLVSAQYAAMVLCIIISPIVIRKLGRVVTIGGMALISIPFIFIIANGSAFGSSMTLAVGIGLFLRSGAMNMAMPAQQALPMELVPNEMRPAYASVIFLSSAAAQIIAGSFATWFFNNVPNGYSVAYYITGAIYASAAIMLLVVFTKKYNKPSIKPEKEREVELA